MDNYDPLTHRHGFLGRIEHLITLEERPHFHELWERHLAAMRATPGAFSYFLPPGMGRYAWASGVLHQIANDIALLLYPDEEELDVIVAFDFADNNGIVFVGTSNSRYYDIAQVMLRIPSAGARSGLNAAAIPHPAIIGGAPAGGAGNNPVLGAARVVGNNNNPVIGAAPAEVVENNPVPFNQHGLDNAAANVELVADMGNAPAQRDGKKVPKPRNMWIFYRIEKHKQIVAENPNMHTSKISKLVSEMWKNEPFEVRQRYKAKAEQEKEMYRLIYPGYKCAPRKSAEIKKRKSAKAQPGEIVHGDQAILRLPEEVEAFNVINNYIRRNPHVNQPAAPMLPVPAQNQRRIAEEAQQEEQRLDLLAWNHAQLLDRMEQARLQHQAAGLVNEEAAQHAVLEQGIDVADINFGAFDMDPFNVGQQQFQQDFVEEIVDIQPVAAPVEGQAVVQAPDNGFVENEYDVVIQRHARHLRAIQDAFRNDVEALGLEYTPAYDHLQDVVANL